MSWEKWVLVAWFIMAAIHSIMNFESASASDRAAVVAKVGLLFTLLFGAGLVWLAVHA